MFLTSCLAPCSACVCLFWTAYSIITILRKAFHNLVPTRSQGSGNNPKSIHYCPCAPSSLTLIPTPTLKRFLVLMTCVLSMTFSGKLGPVTEGRGWDAGSSSVLCHQHHPEVDWTNKYVHTPDLARPQVLCAHLQVQTLSHRAIGQLWVGKPHPLAFPCRGQAGPDVHIEGPRVLRSWG